MPSHLIKIHFSFYSHSIESGRLRFDALYSVLFCYA